MIELNKIYNEDCLEGMKRIPDKTVNAIVTDPPYLYLKHKLDREWNEDAVFEQWNRILKDDGFIVIFGRGIPFYRWNVKLEQYDFKFKEEIIWNKRNISSPFLKLGRVHETVSLLTKKGSINKVKVPYIDKKKFELENVIQDIKRIKSALGNPASLERIKRYLETNEFDWIGERTQKHNLTGQKTKGNDRAVLTMRGLVEGKLETDIIDCNQEHYKKLHPTQKPIELMERLINLVTSEEDIILDPFCGSGSTALACQNLNRNYIGFEIDKEYYDKSLERIKNNVIRLDLFEEAK